MDLDLQSFITGGIIGATGILFLNFLFKFNFQSKQKAPARRKVEEGKPPLVLISCGSFSPVTNMHLRLFEEARNHLAKDFSVVLGIMSPTNDEYKKWKSSLIHSRHRMKMVDLALEDSSWIEVRDFEVKQKQWIRTRPTLTHYKSELQKEYGPDVEVRYLCGADILEAMCKPNSLWKAVDVQYILKEFGIAAICRQDAPDLTSYIQSQDLLRPYADRIHLISPEVENNISSSLVRKLLQEGQSISYLVPSQVESYIYEQSLFVESMI